MSLDCMDIAKCLLETTAFSFGPVIAIASARHGQKQWIKCEILMSMVMGLIFYIKPEMFLSLVLNSTQKDYHNFLCMMYGFYIIYSVLVPLFHLESMDKSIFYGHHCSKVVSSTLLILNDVISYNQGVHWNENLLCLFTGYHLVSLVINLHFLRIGDKPWGRHPYTDKVDAIARIDSFIYLIAGVFVYAFPEKAMLDLTEMNESYTALGRSCAAILLSLSLESYCLSEFLFLGDKKKFMHARMVGSLVKALVIVHANLYWKILSLNSFLVLFTINAAYNLVVVYGFLVTPKEPKQKSSD
ncbi:hypothetical protein BpHYR1_032466 [Brachionus plicatilis]|uniref:Uncharacterized protein n=1 Tax=Brachionus plicatilis TaxID=10195 RepID=A0A3M7T9Q0_BRAPC|nr:hypothetical protein BpHYR1_032466 [Brachionus plicatilis]